jgi:hypothetical protein
MAAFAPHDGNNSGKHGSELTAVGIRRAGLSFDMNAATAYVAIFALRRLNRLG